MKRPCAEVLCPCSSLIEVDHEHGSGRYPDAVIVWKTGYIDALLVPAADKVSRLCCLVSGGRPCRVRFGSIAFHVCTNI